MGATYSVVFFMALEQAFISLAWWRYQRHLSAFLSATTAGYVGGWVESALMRLPDAFLAFPKLILALAFASALGAGLENAVLAIALTAWPPYARIARAETLTVRNSDYLAAARMTGAGDWRILFGHIMPMCMPSLIVRFHSIWQALS